MSKEAREERVAVSLGDLIARANQLRDYLTVLDSQINTYLSRINELQIVLNTLDNIPINGVRGLVALDRLNTAFISAEIRSDWLDNVIVNIGRNYYMKTSKEEAVKIIREKLNAYSKVLNNLRKQYQTLLDEYNTIQQILASIYSRQAEQQQRQTS